jgi:hypothetical protein
MLARQSLARLSPLLLRNHCFARSFASDADAPSVMLYQYAICPFCNKAKALLAYAGIDYDAVEVNPLTKAELKPW